MNRSVIRNVTPQTNSDRLWAMMKALALFIIVVSAWMTLAVAAVVVAMAIALFALLRRLRAD